MKTFLTVLFVFLFVIIIMTVVSMPLWLGVRGFGPIKTEVVTIERTYVDYSGSTKGGPESHYMVVTNKGIFEVDNGWILGMWNADEVYGKIIPKYTYQITTKGNRVVNFLYQEYPYIIKAERVTEL
jgi:hypothetical protein